MTGTGTTVPKSATVELADDELNADIFGGGHIIIDVAGWFTSY